MKENKRYIIKHAVDTFGNYAFLARAMGVTDSCVSGAFKNGVLTNNFMEKLQMALEHKAKMLRELDEMLMEVEDERGMF